MRDKMRDKFVAMGFIAFLVGLIICSGAWQAHLYTECKNGDMGACVLLMRK